MIGDRIEDCAAAKRKCEALPVPIPECAGKRRNGCLPGIQRDVGKVAQALAGARQIGQNGAKTMIGERAHHRHGKAPHPVGFLEQCGKDEKRQARRVAMVQHRLRSRFPDIGFRHAPTLRAA